MNEFATAFVVWLSMSVSFSSADILRGNQHHHPTTSSDNNRHPKTAMAQLRSANVSNMIYGTLYFTQEQGLGVFVSGVIYGMSEGKHGFHIHEINRLGNACRDAGSHFNPNMTTHGDPSDPSVPRHIGDLGNVHSVANPVLSNAAYVLIYDPVITLDGPNSVLDRTVVVHAGEDDLGSGTNAESLKTGNAGPRVACGLIQEVKIFD